MTLQNDAAVRRWSESGKRGKSLLGSYPPMQNVYNEMEVSDLSNYKKEE
jgi:hypothetical protein